MEARYINAKEYENLARRNDWKAKKPLQHIQERPLHINKTYHHTYSFSTDNKKRPCISAEALFLIGV